MAQEVFFRVSNKKQLSRMIEQLLFITDIRVLWLKKTTDSSMKGPRVGTGPAVTYLEPALWRQLAEADYGSGFLFFLAAAAMPDNQLIILRPSSVVSIFILSFDFDSSRGTRFCAFPVALTKSESPLLQETSCVNGPSHLQNVFSE